MKPVKIICENFKGLDFEHDLKPVNMFTGPNESGKTARLRAVPVALLGYDPEIGKQPIATIGFSSEQRLEMKVHMEFDDDSKITRTFKRNAKGEVNRVNSGTIPDVPAVIFDAGDYLEATAQERIKAVFNRIDISKIIISDEDLIAKLSKIEVLPAAESVKAVAAMVELVQKTIATRTKMKMTIQGWLEDLVKTLQEHAKDFKIKHDTANTQLHTLRPNGKTPESAQARIDELTKQMREIDQKIADYNAAKKNFDGTETRRNFLRQQLQKPPADVATLQKEKEKLEASLAEMSSSTPELHKEMDALATEYHRLDAGIKKMEADVETITARRTELEGKVKCPYCKSNRQGWKDEHKTELDQQIKDLQAKITENTTQRDLVAEQGRKVKADLHASQQSDLAKSTKEASLATVKDRIAAAQKSVNERAAMEGELKGLEQITAPDSTGLSELQVQHSNLSNEVSILNTQETQFRQFNANKETFTKTEKSSIEYLVKVEVYKQAAALVIAEQKAIVSKAFDSILAPARRFTDGIIGGRLDYQNDELGITTSKGWVGHKFMSGRGKDLAYLGLQVALAQQSPIKVILLDEFGDFDKPTKIQVVTRLIELTGENFIDCAFCADPDGELYRNIDHKDFQLIELKCE
jgi:AAA15 family ATPase/GTPase